MAKADVLALVQKYTEDQADAAIIDGYYDDEVRRLAFGPGYLTNQTLLTASAGTAVYSPPTSAVRRLALFFDDRELTLESKTTIAAAHGREWRQKRGRPDSYVVEDESKHDFRIVPTPDAQTDESKLIVFGEPLGRDFQPNSVVLVHTEVRPDVPRWLEMPIVFAILAREYSRYSDHTDLELSALCGKLSALLFGMVA